MIQLPVTTAARVPPHARPVVQTVIAEHTKALAHEIEHGTPDSITKAAKRWFILPKLLFGHATLRGGKRGNAQLTATLFRRVREINAGRESLLWQAVLDSAPRHSRAKKRITSRGTSKKYASWSKLELLARPPTVSVTRRRLQGTRSLCKPPRTCFLSAHQWPLTPTTSKRGSRRSLNC